MKNWNKYSEKFKVQSYHTIGKMVQLKGVHKKIRPPEIVECSKSKM